VDDERVGERIGKELVGPRGGAAAGTARRGGGVSAWVPERYLRTRTPEQVRLPLRDGGTTGGTIPVQIEFRHAPGSSAITLLARDRPLLFADMGGALAAWGMNIVTADAFGNLQGVVVDNFRFLPTPFRTLEMNQSEHATFVANIPRCDGGQDCSGEAAEADGGAGAEKLPKVVVEARVDYDDDVSSHSTLLQVVAQDIPGLLRAISLRWLSAGAISTWRWWTPRARRPSTSSTSRATGRSWTRSNRRS